MSFEKFDQLGMKREKDDKGVAIVTKNTLKIDGQDVSYEGPAELSKALAESYQVMECFSRQMFRFGMGRMELAPRVHYGGEEVKIVSRNSKKDSCHIQSMAQKMKSSKGDMKQSLLEMVSNPAFRLRVEAD